MRELLDLAGGPVGTLKAFSPGGASSGFLPASKLDVAMDFRALAVEGSMLGFAGVVKGEAHPQHIAAHKTLTRIGL